MVAATEAINIVEASLENNVKINIQKMFIFTCFTITSLIVVLLCLAITNVTTAK